jgi:hypothetical protein
VIQLAKFKQFGALTESYGDTPIVIQNGWQFKKLVRSWRDDFFVP